LANIGQEENLKGQKTQKGNNIERYYALLKDKIPIIVETVKGERKVTSLS